MFICPLKRNCMLHAGKTVYFFFFFFYFKLSLFYLAKWYDFSGTLEVWKQKENWNIQPTDTLTLVLL